MPLTVGVPGNPVRTYTLPSASDKGQLISVATPKDLYVISTRIGFAVADVPSVGPFDPSALTKYGTYDATTLWVGGSCDTALATLSFAVAFYESGSLLMGISQGYSVTTGSFYQVGSAYPIIGSPISIDILGAANISIIVTSITAGTWTLYYKLI